MALERTGQVEDGAAALTSDNASGAKRAAVSDSVNLVAHRLCWVAAQDEIAVHGMQQVVVLDGLGSRPQRLGDDEAAEDASPGIVRTLADPNIRAVRLQVEHRGDVGGNALVGQILGLAHGSETTGTDYWLPQPHQSFALTRLTSCHDCCFDHWCEFWNWPQRGR